jgi:hypothetical protein
MRLESFRYLDKFMAGEASLLTAYWIKMQCICRNIAIHLRNLFYDFRIKFMQTF